ncbi:MAG: hypothetical protein VX694_00315, partial [Planctomycetota bacterium]|nr:hypothetical protein [Planctomycetota bacterium]
MESKNQITQREELYGTAWTASYRIRNHRFRRPAGDSVSVGNVLTQGEPHIHLAQRDGHAQAALKQRRA